LGLGAEVVEVKNREKRRETLERHGATDDEIEFLAPNHGDCQRVELNAMTSRQLVDFVEQQLDTHRVAKVVPEKQVLQQHARHLLEIKYTDELIAKHAKDIARRAKAALPRALADKVTALLRVEPELSWDQALSRIIEGA
jgi:hypothetical protein